MSSRVIADARFSFLYYAVVSGRSFCLSPLHAVVLFSLSTSILQAFADKPSRTKGLCFVCREEPPKSIALRL